MIVTHGWRVNEGVSLYVGKLPFRKQVCVYAANRHPWVDEDGETQVGGSLQVLAWCKSEQDAEALLDLIDQLADR